MLGRLFLLLAGTCAVAALPEGAAARLYHPTMYGPWGLVCPTAENSTEIVSCEVEYRPQGLNAGWKVRLQVGDHARIVSWGMNGSNCREAEIREAVERPYSLFTANVGSAQMEAFAARVFRVMQTHRNFFGSCNAMRQLVGPFPEAPLNTTSTDFNLAFVAAERQLQAQHLRASSQGDR